VEFGAFILHCLEALSHLAPRFTVSCGGSLREFYVVLDWCRHELVVSSNSHWTVLSETIASATNFLSMQSHLLVLL